MAQLVNAQHGYRHAIDEFVDWYCSEPRLAFNRIVVLRYRSYLESRSTGSRNGQPPPGRCAAARVRSCRLRPAQFGSRGWHSPRQRCEECERVEVVRIFAGKRTHGAGIGETQLAIVGIGSGGEARGNGLDVILLDGRGRVT